MVSIMVNKRPYKVSVRDIMDKYYEMFRGKNSTKKKDVFKRPDSPEHSQCDSDTDGWTRLRRGWGLNEEEWVVWERNQSVIYLDYTVSHLLRLVARSEWIWVCKWGPHKFLGILSMLRVSEVCKNKLFSSFAQVSWVLCPRSGVEFEYHESLYSNSTHHKNSLYSTQVLKYSL
jgi:hypothetical protein